MELVKKLYQRKDAWFQIYLSVDAIHEFEIYQFNSIGGEPVFRIQMAEWSAEFINEVFSALVIEAKETPIVRIQLRNEISPIFKKVTNNISLDLLLVDLACESYTIELLKECIGSFLRISTLKIMWSSQLAHLINLLDYLTQEKLIKCVIIHLNKKQQEVIEFLATHNFDLVCQEKIIGKSKCTEIIINNE
jgi:hypothetical protein